MPDGKVAIVTGGSPEDRLQYFDEHAVAVPWVPTSAPAPSAKIALATIWPLRSPYCKWRLQSSTATTRTVLLRVEADSALATRNALKAAWQPMKPIWVREMSGRNPSEFISSRSTPGLAKPSTGAGHQMHNRAWCDPCFDQTAFGCLGRKPACLDLVAGEPCPGSWPLISI